MAKRLKHPLLTRSCGKKTRSFRGTNPVIFEALFSPIHPLLWLQYMSEHIGSNGPKPYLDHCPVWGLPKKWIPRKEQKKGIQEHIYGVSQPFSEPPVILSSGIPWNDWMLLPGICFFLAYFLYSLNSCWHLPSTSSDQAVPAQLPQGAAVPMTLGCPAAPWSPDLRSVFPVPDPALILKLNQLVKQSCGIMFTHTSFLRCPRLLLNWSFRKGRAPCCAKSLLASLRHDQDLGLSPTHS